MTFRALFFVTVLLACAQEAPKPATKAPRLQNRDEIMKLREYASRISLQPGDSLLIPVWARIDEQGIPNWPEVKDEIPNQMAKQAAIELVRKMRFTPGLLDGKPQSVLLKIPVKLVRPAQ